MSAPKEPTHLLCPKAPEAIGMEATHHMAPRGAVMVCIYCWKNRAEILRDQEEENDEHA